MFDSSSPVSSPRGSLRRLTHWYGQLLNWLLVASVAILIFPVSLQIFSRFTQLIPAYIWTEEMARFLFVWMIMIGANVGVRDGAHFTVDIFPRLSPRSEAAVSLMSGIFVLVFAMVFLIWGIEFTRFAVNRISELAEMPLWLIHIAWPITGATWLMFQGERMYDSARVLMGRAP
ncbi:MAG: TRAP transporter small permease [Alphaproteobacteria bacterium]|nr:TRAP transporter small permease [Alphaproteobacteria bacterium]